MRAEGFAMKRLICLILAVSLLLGGCGVIRDKHAAGTEVPASVLDMSGLEYYGRVMKTAVYFLNETSRTLMAELRTLVIEQDTNPAAAAVRELLKGTSNDSLASVAPEGMTLDFIEYSKEVVNVYLRYDGERMQDEPAYILEQAIANTVTDILGPVSVCVFYNGVREGVLGFPSAPLKKQTGNIDDAWSSAKSKYAPETQTATTTETTPGGSGTGAPNADEEPKIKTSEISTVLYFTATGGSYILPEVRIVKYTEDQFVAGLIQELTKGPQNTASMRSPLVADIELKDSAMIDAGDGKFNLELYFSKSPVRSGYAASTGALQSYAALIYTITGFIPNIKTVDIYVAGKRVMTVDEENWFYYGMKRSDYVGFIGSSAPVYFGDKSSDLLVEVQRSMEQGKIWSPRERVLEVFNGPLEEDGDNVWTVTRTGMTGDDILSVDVYNDIAYVDLSAHFKEVCDGLPQKSEMLLVYSIVNTITAMDGINRVQFTVEGKQTDELAGYLCVSDPFLRNFGIIKNR